MTIRRAVLPSVLFAALATPALAAPAPPTITEPPTDGQVLNPADVHMEASYFDPNGVPHFSTDWELWDTDAGERAWSRLGVSSPPNLLVHIHLGDGTFEGSYAGHTQLKFDTAYKLRVRFRNANGEDSAWSERPFRTSPEGPPGVPGPMPWVTFEPGYTVEIVATGFQLPVNIAFVPTLGPNPTDPFLYVAELYGTIKVVFRDGTLSDYATNLLNFDPTGVFPGSGEQGLAGIAVDPVTGDVFASMLYEDTPSLEDPKPHYAKVIRLHSTDGGRTAATQTTVLDMFGERFYESHQISNVSIGPDGKLYVHLGDGFDSSAAQDLDSFRGKILRMNLDGTAFAGNPFYDVLDGITARDYVFAYGFRNPFGGAWRAADGSHYEIENGPDVDRFAKVDAGRNYLWDGSDASMLNFALYNWGLPCPPCGPAHAPVNIAFVQPATFAGSGFPFAKMDHAFVTESGPTYAFGPQELGKRIVEFALDPMGTSATGPTTLVEYNGTGRATAVGIAAGPDGLYFTDLYKDEGFDPIAPGANLLRIRFREGPVAASRQPRRFPAEPVIDAPLGPVGSARSGPRPAVRPAIERSQLPGPTRGRPHVTRRSPGPRLANREQSPVSPAWSGTPPGSSTWTTVGLLDTFFSFSNTTGSALTGTLVLVDPTGAVVSSLALPIPGHGTADVSTTSPGIPRDRTGTWRFTHDGPPGSVLVEAAIGTDKH